MFQDMNISPYKVMFNSKHAKWVEILYGEVCFLLDAPGSGRRKT